MEVGSQISFCCSVHVEAVSGGSPRLLVFFLLAMKTCCHRFGCMVLKHVIHTLHFNLPVFSLARLAWNPVLVWSAKWLTGEETS